LIETGTYSGQMVEAMRQHFSRVVSIELGEEWYRRAAKRFAACPTVEIVHGDSAMMLPGILAGLHEPALFWLDGHYSGGTTARGEIDTPIVRELEHILGHSVKGHVVLIDDARDFTGSGDYPTVDAVERTVRHAWPRASFGVAEDIIRIVQSG